MHIAVLSAVERKQGLLINATLVENNIDRPTVLLRNETRLHDQPIPFVEHVDLVVSWLGQHSPYVQRACYSVR